ncbi:MAG: photosynthetic complex assembly protein PuhC [Wenzhouxiangella sp.]|nr:photosynthetic complex assembly protein PuhC [Wenzhouxiangella sp.]
MTDKNHSDDIRVPVSALIGISAVLLAVLAAVFWFRASGNEPISQVPIPEQVTEVRKLRFQDGPDGTVSVYSVSENASDELIQVIPTGEGGFIRGVLRSLARARRASEIGAEQPFVLIRQADGAMFLEDPATDQRIYLQAFGPASAEAFETLLPETPVQP